MKNLKITVNGTAYDVQVEEVAAGAAPVSLLPLRLPSLPHPPLRLLRPLLPLRPPLRYPPALRP